MTLKVIIQTKGGLQPPQPPPPGSATVVCVKGEGLKNRFSNS